MKIRIQLLLLFLSVLFFANSQNIQLHYDFGNHLYKELDARPKLTSTVEMFRPDKWGSTFFFVDMDYTSEGVAMAYWEIAREFKFWDNPFSAHVEYNGGLNFINNAYLAGPTYTFNNSDFTSGFSFSMMYKYIQKNPEPHNFQLTAVWYVHFSDNKYTFTGFADFWREKNALNGASYVFMSEPQFWVNLNSFKFAADNFNLSIGTEVELTNNFGVMKGFYCIPTLGIKWTFS